jgi:hypothetical protein
MKHQIGSLKKRRKHRSIKGPISVIGTVMITKIDGSRIVTTPNKLTDTYANKITHSRKLQSGALRCTSRGKFFYTYIDLGGENKIRRKYNYVIVSS